MNNDSITFEEALEFIQKRLYLQDKTQLSLQEETILRGAWDDSSYDEIGHSLYLSQGYTRNLASALWKKLSSLLETKMTKSHFRYVIKQVMRENVIDEAWINEENETNQRETILIVDDQVENLSVLSQLLTSQGYNVKSATSGTLALRFLERSLPDLILLDILMPELDGYEVCKLIKGNDKTQKIPLIFISALNDGSDKAKAFNLGGSDYISKPFEPQEILARVSYQIKLKKQEERLEAEIKEHQNTIEILSQSRSILTSVLNHTPIGIAAFEAIRSSVTAEIIDFRCILLNPAFVSCFGFNKTDLILKESYKEFFEIYNLPKIQDLKRVIETGQPLQCFLEYSSRSYYVYGFKLGDGITLSLEPLSSREILSNR